MLIRKINLFIIGNILDETGSLAEESFLKMLVINLFLKKERYLWLIYLFTKMIIITNSSSFGLELIARGKEFVL